MDTLDILIDVMEQSVKKNGGIEMTTAHFLYILKLVKKQQDKNSYLDMVGTHDPYWD